MGGKNYIPALKNKCMVVWLQMLTAAAVPVWFSSDAVKRGTDQLTTLPSP